MGLYCLIFVLSFVYEFLFIKYTLSVTALKEYAATLFGVSLFLIGALTTKLYISNSFFLVPEGLGLALGIFLSVRWQKDPTSPSQTQLLKRLRASLGLALPESNKTLKETNKI